MSLTSKYKLAEQARRIILGGHPTPDSGAKMQELMLYVSQAFSSIVSRIFFVGKNEGESYVNGNFIYPFEDIKVEKDPVQDKFFSELPATTVTLPYDIGIFQISLEKDQGRVFVPVANGFSGLTEGLEVGLLEGRIAYYLEKNRVYYDNMEEINKVDKVLMKLVAPLGSVEDEDEINVNDDVQKEIVEMTVGLYRNQEATPHDEQNDDVKENANVR